MPLTVTRHTTYTTPAFGYSDRAFQFRWNGSQIVNIFEGTIENGMFVPYQEIDVMTIVGHDGGGAKEAQVHACVNRWLRDMEDIHDGDRGLRVN
jgi:hypothetical protein